MRIEQAILGEERRGHGLRAASGDRRFADELASRLDLPDTAPSGVTWSPYLSGFPHSGRYVVARTFLDPAATRSGMVLAHALIAPLDEAVLLPDLGALVHLLMEEPRQPDSLDAIEVLTDESPPPEAPGLVGLAEALAASGPGPVVHVGLPGFEDLVVALWRYLWPEVRRSFSFRLSFGPADLIEDPAPALVCTPVALATRFRGARVVDPTPREPTSATAALLSGRAAPASPLSFSASLGAIPGTIAELRLAETAQVQAAAASRSPEDASAAVRLVQRLSPDPDKGREIKGGLLAILASHIQIAGPRTILTLRNLDLSGFEEAPALWEDLGRRVASGGFEPGEDAATGAIVRSAATTSGAVKSWRDAVESGLRSAVRGGEAGSALWRLFESDPTLPKAVADALDLDEVLQKTLVDGAPPTIGDNAGRAVRALAHERGLAELHGVASSALASPIEAVLAQISMEGTTGGGGGLALALRRASPAQVVSCALEIEDPRLVELAGRAVAESPGAMAGVDLASTRARAVWGAALSIDARSWTAPDDPTTALDAILDDLVAGRIVDQALLHALGGTSLGDLGRYGRRAEVWGRLDDRCVPRFLQATARGWLEAAASGRAPYAADPRLERAIMAADPLSIAAGRTSGGLVAGVRLADALPGIPEWSFLPWLEAALDRNRSVQRPDAEDLGRLIRNRGWRQAARRLADRLRYQSRDDLRPALSLAASALALADRWMLGLWAPSPDEKWSELEELAARLYSGGPSDNCLWDRSGGNDADLPLGGNGRSGWHAVLGHMRRDGGRVRVDRLLREMLVDHPANEGLRFMSRDPEFRESMWGR